MPRLPRNGGSLLVLFLEKENLFKHLSKHFLLIFVVWLFPRQVTRVEMLGLEIRDPAIRLFTLS